MGGPQQLEAQLVVSCARTGADVEDGVSDILERPLQWDVVVETARTHGVTVLVFETLRDHYQDAVPDDTFQKLRTQSQHVARRNLRTLQEVTALSSVFDRHDIRAIPYRGPVVATLAYGNVSRRSFGDIDFLLPHEQLTAARSILTERGYRPRYTRESTTELTETQQWAYTRFARDYPFVHATDPLEVELHWRVVSQHFPTSIDLEMVWNRRSMQSIAGTDVPVLSPEDRLLMLCVHGTRHRWERLQWICDVAEFLERYAVDWSAIARRAEEHHCERMLYLGLAVARELYDVGLPETVQKSIDDDSTIDSLTKHVCDRLFDETDYWSLDLKRYQARTLERRRDRARYWIHWAFKPDRPDIESVAFPKPLVPLYSVVRWIRLANATVNWVSSDDGTVSDPDVDREERNVP